MVLRITALSVSALLLASSGRAQIQPLIEKNCLGCHNAKVKQGGFDMSSRETILKGSEHGKVVVPGNPEDSQLYKLVSHVSEPGMPFKGKKLPDDVIAQFADWIRAGLPYGEVEDADAVFAKEAAKHWAFRKPVKPTPPSVTGNPVDAFISAEL